MIIWNGTCHVHENFSLEEIVKLKNKYPDAKIIVHPECEMPIRLIAGFYRINFCPAVIYKKDNSNVYIIATEPGIISDEKSKSA